MVIEALLGEESRNHSMLGKSMIKIDRIDHLVLTVASVERCCDFYSRVLGLNVITFGANRKALAFGNQKINLHEVGNEVNPKSYKPTPGSADICFIASSKLEEVLVRLRENHINIEDGPVQRIGATGPICSVYFRDPDRNLIEVSNYV